MTDFLSVAAAGTQVTTGASSATTAIPNNAAGDAGATAPPAGARDLLRAAGLFRHHVHDGGHPPHGERGGAARRPAFTHIAHLQETAAAKFVMTPLEG